MRWRGPGLGAVSLLLIGVCACSPNAPAPQTDTGRTEDAHQSAEPTPPTRTVPDPSVRPSPEDRPTFDEPAPTDVTAAEITGLLEDGLLPLAPAHGGAFETMVNSLDAQPAFDVMLLGDSMVQQGVDPAVMSTELSGVGADVTVFNAASSRARWGINLMLAKHLTQTDKTPRVALVGITTRAGENDLFYSSEASRSPFSAVVEGCDRPRTSTWTPGVESSCRRAVTDPLHRFRDGGGQLARARRGRPPQTNLYLDRDSWLRSDGYIVHAGVSVEEVTAVSDARMRRGFPGFPRRDERATEEFVSMVRLLQRHGAQVISFELPYTPAHQDNLQEVGRNYDQRRQRVATELATAAGIPHIPVDRFGSWWGDGDSRDAIHLAPLGAAKFTRQLLDTPRLRQQLTP